MNNTRDRLIQTTAALLQQQGYRNTGLNQIITESGTPKGSLYHYFPGGKDELVIAALQAAADTVHRQLEQTLPQCPDPLTAWVALTENFSQQLVESGFRKGCPVATVALEQAALNPSIQTACAEAYQQWEATLAEFLEAHAQPRELASTLLSLLEGALLLSRARLSTTPLLATRALAEQLLKPSRISPHA